MSVHEIPIQLVRFPDPIADGSDFFKVRRGPCLGDEYEIPPYGMLDIWSTAI